MWNAKLHCTRGVREKGAQFWSGCVVIGLYSVSCMLQRNCLKDSLTQWKCHWSITVWLKVRYIGLIIVIILMHLSGNSDVIKILSAYFTTNLWLFFDLKISKIKTCIGSIFTLIGTLYSWANLRSKHHVSKTHTWR